MQRVGKMVRLTFVLMCKTEWYYFNWVIYRTASLGCKTAVMYETHNKTKLHIRNPKQLAGSSIFFFKCCTACFNSNCSTAVRHRRNHCVEGDKMSAFPDNQRSVLGHTPVYDCVSVAS